MAHWIDKIERKHKRSQRRSMSFQKMVLEKKNLIKTNYEKNKETYDSFIEIMFNLSERVNDLPEEHREPFKKISAVSKKSKLDNKLHYFYTSRRKQKTNFLLSLFIKPTQVKNIRTFYIYVSKHEDFVNFELKEDFLIRRRVIIEEKSKKSRNRKDNRSKDRLHVIYHFPMSKLNKDTALEIIDWLAFKNPLQALKFYNDFPDEEKQFF
ncbi:MAG: hypothetical protein GX128_06170 [Bacteroidales bacterium]|jgi:hypothetical protein|nr:hypothetical protein [Bacteroidales bacterium]